MTSNPSQAIFEHFSRVSSILSKYDLDLNTRRTILDTVDVLAAEPPRVTYQEVQCPGTCKPAIWCEPLDAPASHVILYVHGGGGFTGSPSAYRKLAAHIALASGVRTLVLDYRLAPEHPFPAGLDDVVTAYQWLSRQKKIPSENIALVGDSAGAGIALCSIIRLKQLKADLPAAVAAVCPWVDMELTGETYDSNADKDAIGSRAGLEAMAAMLLNGASPKSPLVNALYADFSGYVSLYIVGAGDEVFLDDARRLAVLAKEKDVDVHLEIATGMQHDFVFMAGRAPEADATIQRLGDWMKLKLRLK
ncbi:uncharacterized protein PV06_03736 [Exophiala oligosperma]|uniref:Alpha/beta hydrolase fold-3 domain-containing protein n=1 Tax=Exophiala oligosperma TaxID=215243 RepID=A0A0D2DR14_9EURO|nr:uncharacterized protein PV06_03736 [Exophiala oligosperma]KIW45338.1 hypothetical protein PV06_03736 [Exophiala oligosperma]